MKILGSKVFWRYTLSYLLLVSVILIAAFFCLDTLNIRMNEIITEGNRLAVNRYKEAVDAQLSAMVKMSDDFIMDEKVPAFLKKKRPLQSSDHYDAVLISDTVKAVMYRYDSPLVHDVFLYFPSTDSVITSNAHTSAELFFRDVYPLSSGEDYQQCFSNQVGSGFFALKDVRCVEKSSGKSLPVVCRALKKPSGKMTCLIGFLLDPAELETMMHESGTGEENRLYICLMDGTSAFSSEEDEVLSANAATTIASGALNLQYCLVSNYTGLTSIINGARSELYAALGICLACSLVLACALAFANYRPISLLWKRVDAPAAAKPGLRNEITDINSYIYTIVQANTVQDERIKDMLLVYNSKLLADFVEGRLTENEVNWESLEESGSLLDKPCFMVILLKVNAPDEMTDENLPACYEAASMAMQVFGELGTCVNVRREENELQLLLNFDTPETSAAVKRAALVLQEQLERQKGLSVAFALGGVTGRGAVWQSAQQAQRTMQSIYLDQRVSVLSYDEFLKPAGMTVDYFQDYEISLLNYLKSGNLQGMQQLLDEMFDSAAGASAASQVQILMLHVLESCLEVSRQMRIGLEKIYGYDDAPLTHIAQFSSISQFKAFILEICQKLVNENAARQENDEALKNAVVAFVNEKYADNNLNVNMLADHLKVSQSYLSTHFKRQSGINASDYIHIVRIDRAKQLMNDASLSLTQIAKRTGYISDATFIRSFKKYEGITPGAYRKNFIHT